MRAVVVSQWGGPEVLTETELERPEPGPAEILVRVRAAGVNPVDWKTRASGGLISWAAVPAVGWDVSGTVEAVGPGVTLFQPGDEVFGMPRFPHQAGAYAEYVTGPARHFVRKPGNIDHTGAAALPLAALTAYQALIDTAGLTAGQRVLIHAAAGGVGHLAVQIAKAYGAYVIGTASAGKHELLRSLGADELIDYRSTDFAGALGEDVDIVLDSVGGDYGQRSLAVLRPGGHLVTLPSPDDVPAHAPGVHTGWTLVEPDYAGLKAVAALVADGRLRPEIDTVLPLAEAAKAHGIGERGRTTGKIVLTVA
ncbi:NADP-dependent oxidoreductase [Streptomyces sp. ISL-66]|uniref:NADP-dependent oxidoreductase n=1 Tax=Streptomyces sp. ISL-66 TaxID=2819186 RepID=UPI001BEA2DD8|nr:NADP-dependent oxidoreductase [Streptomyces sp. ISL-66]MBT2470852.1 NADP-dependent oxidoreductase [Streptomyces sp. ISL-66]